MALNMGNSSRNAERLMGQLNDIFLARKRELRQLPLMLKASLRLPRLHKEQFDNNHLVHKRTLFRILESIVKDSCGIISIFTTDLFTKFNHWKHVLMQAHRSHRTFSSDQILAGFLYWSPDNFLFLGYFLSYSYFSFCQNLKTAQ